MDRSDVISLISLVYEQDAIGQQIPREVPNEVCCAVDSVSASEWLEAGKQGLNPEYRFTVFADDYSGETVVEYQGQRYGIYRTYRRKSDELELYAERKVGYEGKAGPAC